MKQSKLELFVGGFVLLGLAAVVYLTIKLGAGSIVGGDTYVIEARFTNAGGLNSGGNTVADGSGWSSGGDPRLGENDYSAIATLRLVSGLRLPTDSMASIRPPVSSATMLALAPGADDTWLEAGARIRNDRICG
ncbi:MAG: hypothetical protein R3F13_02395 [Prosthecobacter sp.]